MGDDLKAIIQAAVMLAVDQLSTGVGNIQNSFGVAVRLTALVHFQLHAEITLARTIENRLRLEVVVIDALCRQGVVAVIAIRVIPAIIGIPAVDQSTAMGTAFVMVVIAVLAERDCVRSAVIGLIDPFAAAGTDCGLLVKADRAEQFILKWDQLLRGKSLSAMGTGACPSVSGIHSIFSY